MTEPPRSDAVTEGIRVEVCSDYLHRKSCPEKDYYFFAYNVRISNEGTRRAKLLSRHWIIINSEGERDEVRGPGVVGKTPVLQPGGRFEYTSYCHLNTRWGTMEGTYHMEWENGDPFEVEIGRFFLVGEVPEAAVS